MISVVIPTYKEPEVLDICLESCIRGQQKRNEIIIVVDGFYDINKDIIEKWKDHIMVLNLEQNVGLCRGTNLGVYNASNELILIVNDDNVFPKDWDIRLLKEWEDGVVLTPNQIEPIPSMFRQFHIRNLGRNTKDFSIETFWKYEQSLSKKPSELTGSTLPFMMRKRDYLMVGGWDESYPGPWVVDWEFFMKLEMTGLKMKRTYDGHFYHFVSISDGLEAEKPSEEKIQKEQVCKEYFKYKWGYYPRHNQINNSKLT